MSEVNDNLNCSQASQTCNSNCSACGVDCPSRDNNQAANNFMLEPNKYSSIKKVIAVMSGKGGVGKSMVTALLAAACAKAGLKTAIMDTDITGPSIPKILGVSDKAMGGREGIFPAVSKFGIEIMSMNLLLDSDTAPVVWRGPIIAGMVSQFWQDVEWGDIDIMFIDMPPGTGDVPLTVFQSLPIDGIIAVTSPQDLTNMIVEKAVKMAELMNMKIIALIENMSGFKCPSCGQVHDIFGKSKLEEIAAQNDIKVICRVPIDARIAQAADAGELESLELDLFTPVLNAINNL